MSTAFKINDPKGLYFVTLTITDWIDLFTRDHNRRIVIDALDYCRKNKGLGIWSYVIMTNHIHLIVNASSSLSDIIRDFKRHTTKQLLASVKNEVESRRSWMLNAFSIAGQVENRDDVSHKIWISDNHPIELESGKLFFKKWDIYMKSSSGWICR